MEPEVSRGRISTSQLQTKASDDSGEQREMVATMEASITRLPREAYIIAIIDEVKDNQLKNALIDIMKDAHKSEQHREDERNSAQISRSFHSLYMAGVLFFLVLIAFSVCLHFGAPASCLWAFSVFFLGSVGVFALGRFRAKDGE